MSLALLRLVDIIGGGYVGGHESGVGRGELVIWVMVGGCGCWRWDT